MKAGPALEHVVDGAGDVAVARQLAPFLAHPGFQRGDQRRAVLLAHGQPLIGRQPVDGALDVEQGIDALHRLQRDRRDDRWRAALGLAAGPGLDIGEIEELASGMGPARRLEDRAQRSPLGSYSLP